MSDPGKQARLASGIPVVPVFDGYRAFAILAIVLLHVLIFSGALRDTGDGWAFQLVQGTLGQAVDVLFIISGFVVFLPTVARRGEFGAVGAYAIRRAARLVPAYWITLALLLVLIGVISVVPPIAAPGLGAVGVHLAFLQTPVQLFESVPVGFGVAGPVWTLSLEVIFYALLPLIAGWYYRRPLVGLALAALLTATWHEALLRFDGIVELLGLDLAPETSLRLQTSALTQFPFFAFSFAAGMTAAWAYVRLRESGAAGSLVRRATLVQIGSLVSLTLFAYLVGREAVGGGVILGAEVGRRPPVLALGYSASLATLMLATALGAGRWQRPFANPIARGLGDISYGIYLVHMVIVIYALHALGLLAGGDRGGFSGTQATLISGDGGIGTVLVLGAVVLAGSLLYGYASARLVEQPIRRWARRYGRRRQEPAGLSR